MDDPEQARDALDALGEALGVDARALAERFVHAPEPFELGVALTFGDGPPRALLYYNPRRRGAAGWRRFARGLEGLGLDPAWMEAAKAVVPPERASAILGLDLAADGVTGGTLYLEELHRFHGAEAPAAIERLAGALELPPPATAGAGELYIGAVDFGRTGPLTLKVYRAAGPEQTEAVAAELGAFAPVTPAAHELLFGRGPGSGYIVQRVAGPDGALRRQKVYRCVPYEERAHPGLATGALATLGLEAGPFTALLQAPFRTTSVSVAFAPGAGDPEYATVYQALLRGDRLGRRG